MAMNSGNSTRRLWPVFPAQVGIVADQRNPVRAETVARQPDSRHAVHVKGAVIHPHPAMGQQHQRPIRIGQHQRPYRPPGLPIVQIGIIHQQRLFVPAGRADQSQIDAGRPPVGRLRKTAHDRMQGLTRLAFRQGCHDPCQGIAPGPNQLVVADPLQRLDGQTQGLDFQPGKALRGQGRILGQGIASPAAPSIRAPPARNVAMSR